MIQILQFIIIFAHRTGEVLGQATGDPGSPISIATLIAQFGIAGVFFWLYRDERQERRAAQAALVAVFKDFGSLLEESTKTLDAVHGGLSKQVENVGQHGTPSVADMKRAIDRLERLSDDYSRRLRDAGGDREGRGRSR